MITIRFDRSPPHYQGRNLLRATIDSDVPLAVSGGEWQLVWHTEGKGDEDTGVAAKETVEARLLSAGEPQRIEAQLPRGPWSYSGRLIKISWELQVRLQLRDAKPIEASAAFEVGPLVAKASPLEKTW